MSSPTVAHLHVHSEYSLLDGACNIDKLAERAAAYDQPAIGLTDHGVMNGAIELYKAAKKHGVKPLLGLEAYFVDDRHVRDRKVERNHLTLLAATNEGFKNLTTLSAKGFLEGLHRGKPGVDLELLSMHSEGVICLTGCLASPHEPADHGRQARGGPRAPGRADPDLRPRGRLPRGPEERADRAGAGQRGDAQVRAGDRAARSSARPTCTTCARRTSATTPRCCACRRSPRSRRRRCRSRTNEFYLKSTEEMAESFAEFPGALESTLEIAERCDVEIALGGQLIPSFECPDGLSEKEYLRSLVLDGHARALRRPAARATRSSAWRWSSASSTRWASTPTS